MKNKRIKWGEGVIIPIMLAIVLAILGGCEIWKYCSRPTYFMEPIHELTVPLATKEPLRLDINAADAEQLCELPGIGETLAERIIACREEKGHFSSIEELMSVEGIGESKLDAMRPYVFCNQ